jgi:hypothetical protein
VQLITLDFETYYDPASGYTLSKMTNEAYVRDPRFEVIGVGVKVGAGVSVWMEEADFRRWAATVDWKQVAILCHHTHFDGLILAHHYKVRPKLWLDTLSMARALHPETGGALAKLMPAYGVGEKGHEVELAKGKRRADFTRADWLQYGVYCCNDCDGTHGVFIRMGAKGFPESELWLIDTTVRMYTQPTFEGDVPLLTKFLGEERTRKRKLLAGVAGLPEDTQEDLVLDAVRSRLRSGPKFAALLGEFGIEAPRKISAAQTKKAREANPSAAAVESYAFAKGDPGMQELLEHPDDDVRMLAEARIAVMSGQNETRTQRFISCASRGRMPLYLKYYGAHTGRWSGGDGMNPQNLQRGGVLRDSLKVANGCVTVVSDSGQIEARVNAWLAGDAATLSIFRANDEKTRVYKAALRPLVAALGHEPSKEEEKALDRFLASQGIEEGDFYSDAGGPFFGKRLTKKETPIERQLAKNMLLGLGFSMGWFKFAFELLKGMLGSKPVQFTLEDARKLGALEKVSQFQANEKTRAKISAAPSRLEIEALVIHCAVAAHLVDRYRDASPEIVGTWDLMNDVLAAMDSGTVSTFGPGDCVRVERHRLILPNGMPLRYPGLENHPDDYGRASWSYMGGATGKQRKKLYGGLMDENVVQALARVIVADQMLQLRQKFGYHVATMSHDEVVLMVRAGQEHEALERAITEMRVAPAWAPDLPLNAEGGFGLTYGDAK